MRKRNVLIINSETGNESEAIRQVLEYLNIGMVTVKSIGRPKDFVEIISAEITDFQYDFLIISFHGDEGRICMPKLAESVYEQDEPREDFDSDMVAKYLKLKDKVIINLCCTGGVEQMAAVFSKENAYIASVDYIEGNAALFFVIKLFYEIKQNGRTLKEAFELARATDAETELFIYREPNGSKRP